MKFKLVENLDEDWVDRFDENYYKIKDSLYYRIIDMFYENGGMLDNLANVLSSQVPGYDAAWCNEQTNPQVDHKVEMLASELAKDLMINYTPEKVNEAAEIEVENPGLLEVPKGKKVDELPFSHFEKLVNKKGYEAVIKGLNNLAVWNKNDDKQLSDWAKNTMEKLKEKFRKDESLNEEDKTNVEDKNARFREGPYAVCDPEDDYDNDFWEKEYERTHRNGKV